MSPAEIGLFLGLGVVIGLIAPAAGIAGGLLMVPAFLFIFPRFGIPAGLDAHLAVGSSLGAASLMGLASVPAHARAGNVDWRTFAALAPGLVAGGILGGVLAHLLTDRMLDIVFAALLVAIALWLAAGFRPRGGEAGRQSVRFTLTLPVGFAIGAIGTLIGIGGGVMLVPFLIAAGLATARAAGTSSAAVWVVVLTGAVTNIVTGQSAAGLPAGAFGFLYLPAVFVTAAAAMLCAPFGARLGRALPPSLFRRLFALLLIAVAIKLLI